MYAVIFTARGLAFDSDYEDTIKRMRTLAFERYGCVDITSVTQDDTEVTISYWNSLDDISAWKQDAEHLLAQQSGREKWYRSYDVKVTEVLREYSFK